MKRRLCCRVLVIAMLGFLTLFGSSNVVAQQWDAGRGSIVEPFWPEFEIISYDEGSGKMTLELTMTYYPEAEQKANGDTLLIVIYPFGGLKYEGEDSLIINYRIDNPYKKLLELTIPQNDTSYLVFREQCGNTAHHYGKMFATTGDTLVTRWGTGGNSGDLVIEWTERRHQKPDSDYYRAKREWEEKQALKAQKVYPHGKGTLRHPMNPGDSAYYSTLSDKDKRLWSRMRVLERTPLTDDEQQDIWIDGRFYRRFRGDYEFHEIQGRTTEEINADIQRRHDSLRANPPDNKYDVILDLREVDNYEFARMIIDSLEPKEEKGYYRVIVTKAIMVKLEQHGITYKLTNRPNWDTPAPNRPQSPKSEKKSESRAPTRDGQDVLYTTDHRNKTGHSDSIEMILAKRISSFFLLIGQGDKSLL